MLKVSVPQEIKVPEMDQAFQILMVDELSRLNPACKTSYPS
jgi:hypothetical protein